MSAVAAEAVQLARVWIGTPYIHQASSRGSGADCLGLLRGVWRSLYGSEPEVVPPYSPDWSEPSQEERLWRAAERHLRPVALGYPCDGDILLFRMKAGSVAKHIGIQSQCAPDPRFIHAYRGHGVIENSFSDPWRRRLVARFAFPERT